MNTMLLLRPRPAEGFSYHDYTNKRMPSSAIKSTFHGLTPCKTDWEPGEVIKYEDFYCIKVKGFRDSSGSPSE